VGDFNGDGNPDLAVAVWGSSNISILLGNGDGTFQTKVDYAVGPNPTSVAVGDFNGDSKADLAVANGSFINVSILLGNGDGTFQTKVDYGVGGSPSSVVVGDFNGDSKADLAVANREDDNNVSILLGNGNGTFQTAVNYGVGSDPWSVALGDFNGDSKTDLAVTNRNDNNVSILLGNGNGTFQTAVNYGVGVTPNSVAVGDFNEDGKADLAVTNITTHNVSILLGNGNGTFQTKVDYGVGGNPFSVAVGDFNGDGNPDLSVANWFSSNISILLGNGDGTFQAAVNYGAGTGPFSIAKDDFNGDGNPDLSVVNNGSSNVSILLNLSPAMIGVNPKAGNQGQTLNNVIITGLNFTGATAVSFGAGITVNSFSVNSDTQITASITIAANATLGTRNVTVTDPNGAGTLSSGFTVNLAPPPPAPPPSAPPSSSAPSMRTPNPARVTVLNTNVQPRQTTANQPVTIYANIVNRGDIPGTYTADLKINGEIEQTRSGGIGGNMAIPLKFTVSKDQPGTYKVDVNGQKSHFTVVDSGTAESKAGSPASSKTIGYLFLCFLVAVTLVLGVFVIRRLKHPDYY
jgi:hypothetical protein